MTTLWPKAKFFLRLKALHCISASSWGLSKVSLYLPFKAFPVLLLTYPSCGWFPFLSVTNITKLERFHRVASRLSPAAFSSSSIPLFLSEASLPLPQIALTHFAPSSYERALYLPTSFPTSGFATLGMKPRLQIFMESFCVHSPAHASFYSYIPSLGSPSFSSPFSILHSYFSSRSGSRSP